MKFLIQSYQNPKNVRILEQESEKLPINWKELIKDYSDVEWGFSLSEFVCYCFLKEKYNFPYQVMRLPLSRKNPLTRYKLINMSDMKINEKSLFEKGVPDFLLVNYHDKSVKFFEVKHTEKDLNKNQINWIKKYGHNVFVIKVCAIEDGTGNMYNDQQIIKKNQLNLINRSI